MRRVHFMSIHINRKWMIECQHSFDGKALFTVWLLMIVLGAPAVLPPCPPLPPAQPARRVLHSGVHGQPQPADRYGCPVDGHTGQRPVPHLFHRDLQATLRLRVVGHHLAPSLLCRHRFRADSHGRYGLGGLVQCRGDFQFVTIMFLLSKSSISYDILF